MELAYLWIQISLDLLHKRQFLYEVNFAIISHERDKMCNNEQCPKVHGTHAWTARIILRRKQWRLRGMSGLESEMEEWRTLKFTRHPSCLFLYLDYFFISVHFSLPFPVIINFLLLHLTLFFVSFFFFIYFRNLFE